MTSVTDCVTGDRGNPYYSQKLDKSSDGEQHLLLISLTEAI